MILSEELRERIALMQAAKQGVVHLRIAEAQDLATMLEAIERAQAAQAETFWVADNMLKRLKLIRETI